MKKIFKYIVIAASVLMLASCDLDKRPVTAISTDESMESADDVEHFRIGLYSAAKYVFSGAYTYCPDLQTDLYHALEGFGNFEGAFYHYDVTSTEGTCGSVWYNLYGYIANANFLIEGAEKLIASGKLSASETERVKLYAGEAHFFRAFFYFNLVQYFCKAYDPATATTTFGVPVVTKYAPTAVSSTYPHRGTIAQTYTQILADIATAETEVTTEGEADNIWISEDAVTGLKARVALAMQDWETAYTCAKKLVDDGKYVLQSDKTKYANGWINDDLGESIWQPQIVNNTDTGSSYMYFIYNMSGDDNPQYVPEDWVLALYATDDIRYGAYFDERAITTPCVGTITLMVKYPGNPVICSSGSNKYINRAKVFRISEMYLIAAEAGARAGKADALDFLNTLRSKRIASYSARTYAGEALIKQIKTERTKELFGEGFRLFDLKRWGEGFTRSAGQVPSMVRQEERYANYTVAAGDPRLVWPIPQAEIDANPQMKGEQNEGYVNLK